MLLVQYMQIARKTEQGKHGNGASLDSVGDLGGFTNFCC